MTAADHQPGFQDEGVQEGSLAESLHGLVRLLRLMQRNQSTIAWCVAGCVALAMAYYVAAPRIYRSTAKLLLIEQDSDKVSGVADAGRADDVMATHRELVKSPVVLQNAIANLPPEHRVDLLTVKPSRWIEALNENLSATTVRRTKFIQVSYRSHQPESAVAVVNSVINSYLRFVEETHRSTAADVLDVLTVERDQLQEELLQKQRLLQACRERCGHLAIDQKDSVVDPLIGRAIHLNDSLMQAQQQRLDLQASLASVSAALARGEDMRNYLSVVEEAVGEQMMLASLGLSHQDLEMLSSQQKRLMETQDELRRLTPHYGPNHPRVVSLTEQAAALQQYLSNYHAASGSRYASINNQDLGPMIKRTLEQSVAQAIERERVLSSSFDEARIEAAKQSGELVELDMRSREVERLESLHDVLFEKIAAVDIHQVQAPIRASIVEEPLPEETPVSPRFASLFGSAILGGLALGAVIVFVRDQLDDRFTSPDEMSAQLELPVLSVVRTLNPLPGVGLDAVHMHVDGNSVEAEAFRTLRTSLTLRGDETERLVISSAEPSDGKTTVTSNLGVAFAQIGKRTLIIDADLRKPGMTSLMDLKGQAGVTDILLCEGGVAELAERCLVKTPLEKLDVIPAGPRRPDAAELLSGPNFTELLAWAEARYDQVLVDCPPVLAVSDAQIIGRLVDGVVVVVTPEKNHRRLVVRACDSFLHAGCHVHGVVANRISNKSEGGYGYGYGYGQQYGYGHTEEEELAPVAAPPTSPVDPDPRDWRRLGGDDADPARAA
ncbi:Tyrosine-protein kinase YwqD [Posidoniimonas corsicana]|uniref:Tyrosine-protein kinase YwqD n=1 Tax=Posidoniimonas corsicana TaxID=1938618 RepID=A0A5C5V7Z9_9BACT|nr:polysaccharide biosynthesis tyrosine autokinase [Posidoniimonas corsicana]TWT34009.1 Tyrosine-protein kinase YwqD [Posidoniimonas corsicana]